MIRLVLPYPPSLNAWTRAVQGRQVLSAEAREYKAAIAELLRGRLPAPLTGRLSITGDVLRPRATGDLDNVQKVLLDALKELVFVDDKQIARIELELGQELPPYGRIQLAVVERPTRKEAMLWAMDDHYLAAFERARDRHLAAREGARERRKAKQANGARRTLKGLATSATHNRGIRPR